MWFFLGQAYIYLKFYFLNMSFLVALTNFPAGCHRSSCKYRIGCSELCSEGIGEGE
jgi:hypothetical protein